VPSRVWNERLSVAGKGGEGNEAALERPNMTNTAPSLALSAPKAGSPIMTSLQEWMLVRRREGRREGWRERELRSKG
jgi:hypothetical protein